MYTRTPPTHACSHIHRSPLVCMHTEQTWTQTCMHSRAQYTHTCLHTTGAHIRTCCTRLHTKPALPHYADTDTHADPGTVLVPPEAASPLSHVGLGLCLHCDITLPPMLAVKASSGRGHPGGRWPLGTGHSCLFIPTKLAHVARALCWVSVSGRPSWRGI